MKILVLGRGYEAPFTYLAGAEVDTYDTWELVDVVGYDLVVFTGGEDVTPSLYGEKAHPSTGYATMRDISEEIMYHQCVANDIAMTGICRGSQFLTVMNGGKLVQDIDGHGIHGTHPITAFGYGAVSVTSTHHQMMYPYNIDSHDYAILALSEAHGTPRGLPEGVETIGGVVEAVWYKNTSCLCVQFHPEYMPVESDGFQYYQSLLNDFIIPAIAA
jgi:putative glutamine amidotransferase